MKKLSWNCRKLLQKIYLGLSAAVISSFFAAYQLPVPMYGMQPVEPPPAEKNVRQ